MFTSMDGTVSEMKRDVLVAFYLKKVVPNSETLRQKHLETADDLYKYLLIDPEISAQIMTTPVASAIASLQTFVSNASLNREPGLYLSSQQQDDWKALYHRYSIWVANQLLRIYPENYIDPSLRHSKTNIFKSLETALNQNHLSEDTVGAAVLNYLNQFEIISNLRVINGYQDRDDTNQSNIYFVGRTRIQPDEYYWRKLDMTQRDPMDPNTIYPDAWSAWKKIELPIVNAVNAVVRPVFFKERLFIVWLELRDERNSEEPITEKGAAKTGAIRKLHLKLGFKRFDDSWCPIQGYTLFENDQTSFTEDSINALLLTVTPFDSASLSEINSIHENSGPAEAKAEINEHYPHMICIGIYGKEEKTKKLLPKFYAIDELLTLTECKRDIFKEYPFDKDKISIAKPVTHFSYAVKEPEQKISAGSGFFFIVKANVYEETQELRVSVENDPQLARFAVFGRDAMGMLVESTPEAYSISGNRDTHSRVVNLVYKLEDTGTEIINDGLKLKCSWPAGKVFVRADVRADVTVNISKKPENYKDSTAYITEERDIQLLNFAKDEKDNPKPIRLNTLFAKELIRLANISIDDLLHLYSQYDHPPIHYTGSESNEKDSIDIEHADLDFYGANGLYFWELFFYMPFLVAYSLNLQQHFEQATDWFHYLFDPLQGIPFCWSAKVLLHDVNPPPSMGMALNALSDPDDIAMAHPVHYRKAIFRRYVGNLIDQGDALYRELTPDSLTEAKSYYVMALDLLGPRPDSLVGDDWQPITLRQATQEKNPQLLAFAKQFEGRMENEGTHFMRGYETVIAHDPSIAILNNGLFHQPINESLLTCWDTLKSRLYNLRHNLSIDGKPLHLPLFATPLDPNQLLAQRNQGQGLNNSSLLSDVPPPYYRFSILINKAHYAVDTLIQFGSNLMSIFERRDNREWETLQSEQQKDLLGFTLDIQNDAINLSKANNEALDISKKATEKRFDYYEKLVNDGLFNNERTALGMMSGAAAALYLAIPPLVIAGVVDEAPNIFGLADGGSQWGAASHALAGTFMNTGFALSTTAGALQMSAEYARRLEEWEFQQDLANSDKDLIEKQLEIGKKQLNSAQIQLNQIVKQQEQLRKTLDFYSTRFSNKELNQWMLGQLSSLYFQAYDGVISLCLAAQAAWQYEIGDFKTRFVLPGAWSDMYHGLLVGETLKLYLQRMEQQYLQRHERKLEITKTISLKLLMGEEKFKQLKEQGKIDFDLTEKDYSLDYPGHYLRQITCVSVSLPAVLGPYQDVKATLTQINSHFITTPDKAAFELLWDRKLNHAAIQSDLRARQQIALSTGFDESGLFVLNFGDDRYLPFEGTGAVSSWELDFPNPESHEQKTILNSLTDVIVRVRYTAKEGGSQTEFKTAVDTAVKAETEKRNEAARLLKEQKIQEKTTENTEEKVRF